MFYHWEFTTGSEPAELNWFAEWLGVDFFYDLMTVNLEGKQVDDLSPLTDIMNVNIVLLRKTHTNDLSSLVDLKKLHMLDIRGTKVSDLSPLAGLINLEMLRIEGTPVSEEEINKLQKALPNLRIDRKSATGLSGQKQERCVRARTLLSTGWLAGG